ncbi:MAG: hypothetical protein R6V46_02685 [Desulfatiglandaceae bacterium]
MKMEEVVDVLLHKLSQKGLTPVEVPRLVKDVLSIVGEGGEFTTHTINQGLESLGWDKKVVDPFTFELIIALLDHEGDCEVIRTPIH